VSIDPGIVKYCDWMVGMAISTATGQVIISAPRQGKTAVGAALDATQAIYPV
jgi:hypothetical protein